MEDILNEIENSGKMTDKELAILLTLLNKFAQENNFDHFPQKSPLEADTLESFRKRLYLQGLYKGYELIKELIAYSF